MSELRLYGQRHVKTCLRAYAESEGPSHLVHPSSLISISLSTDRNISLNTIECMNGEQRPGYFAHAQGDLNLYILRMFKVTFSLDAAHIEWIHLLNIPQIFRKEIILLTSSCLGNCGTPWTFLLPFL